VGEAVRRLPEVPLFAGGKSFGGRMTSEAQSVAALPEVRGLVFLGFPLHPSGKPSDARAAHLSELRVPMLFLQGTRDTLADLGLMRALVARLGPIATLEVMPAADHSFHVPKRSGRTDGEVLAEVSGRVEVWMRSVLGGSMRTAQEPWRGLARR
jgi:predicted alpha/beta-hydrolase family hydrolase